jgi:RNA polymerase sigma-70 factor (ECF subfamily)
MSDEVQQLLQRRKYDQALELLLDLYEGRVFRMAVTMLGDAGRAEEVTQDIFVKLWRALPFYDGRAAVSTWLYTIARNTCLTALRSEGYRRTATLDQVQEPAAAEAGPSDVMLQQCVARLPEVQRQVIMLFYFEDRNIADVARALDLPEGTVKSHLHRARQALEEMLK